jgi:hypothetical protein
MELDEPEGTVGLDWYIRLYASFDVDRLHELPGDSTLCMHVLGASQLCSVPPALVPRIPVYIRLNSDSRSLS